MPNIAETLRIIDHTPVTQAVLLEGIHGIGKSECIRDHFLKQGYKFIVLFLGQLSDAGDILGLPDRVDVNGVKKTEFCPPGWWPTGKDLEDAKIVLFLDEINRSKPELQQVVMDLVLNRKLHGRELPKNTRIIAACNPLDDGYYQVEEMEPALLDRFNKYEFRPDVEEWIDWAASSKVNKNVIDFIYKNRQFMDPPSGKEAKSGQVYASRRSWKRVSDILNDNPKLLDDQNLLSNILFGVVGMAAASQFGRFLREQGQGLSAAKVLTNWDRTVEERVRKMDVQDQISVNRNLISFLKENEKNLNASDNLASKWAFNLQQFLDVVPAEVMAEFFSSMMMAHNKNEKWPGKLMNLNNKISTRFIETLQGKDDKKKK